MQVKGKLPIGITEISMMMKLNPEEVRQWPQLNNVRNHFKDFNFGVLSKSSLIDILSNIINNNNHDLYNSGIENAIAVIKACY